jgi:hypothetical protein
MFFFAQIAAAVMSLPTDDEVRDQEDFNEYHENLAHARLAVMMADNKLDQLSGELNKLSVVPASFYKLFKVWRSLPTTDSASVDALLVLLFGKHTASCDWRTYLHVTIAEHASAAAMQRMGFTKYHLLRQLQFDKYIRDDDDKLTSLLSRLAPHDYGVPPPLCLYKVFRHELKDAPLLRCRLMEEAMRDGLLLYCGAPKCKCIQPHNTYQFSNWTPTVLWDHRSPSTLAAFWMEPSRYLVTSTGRYVAQGAFAAQMLRCKAHRSSDCCTARDVLVAAYKHHVRHLALPLLQADLPPYVVAEIVRHAIADIPDFVLVDTEHDRVSVCVKLHQSFGSVYNHRRLLPSADKRQLTQ